VDSDIAGGMLNDQKSSLSESTVDSVIVVGMLNVLFSGSASTLSDKPISPKQDRLVLSSAGKESLNIL
jgi:hypothetical protein